MAEQERNRDGAGEQGQQRKRRRRKVTPEKLLAIVQGYRDGESVPALAARHGLSLTHVCHLLKEHGVQMRSPAERLTGIPRKTRARRCSLEESVFDEPGTEARYWIGFLLADGCVTDKPKDYGQRSLALGLKESDAAHVEALRRFLGSTHKISHNPPSEKSYANGEGTAVLSIRSDRLVAALERYGLAPRKSFVARVVGLEHDADFWRGMVDGDGFVGMHTQGEDRPNPIIGLVGSRDTVDQFAAFVRQVAPGCTAAVRPLHSIWWFRTTGRFAHQVITALYASCTVALARKLVQAREALAWHPVAWRWAHLTPETVAASYRRIGSWKGVAAEFGMPYYTLIMLRQRWKKAGKT